MREATGEDSILSDLIPVYILDATNYALVHVNGEFERLTGCSVESLADTQGQLESLVHPDELPGVHGSIEEAAGLPDGKWVEFDLQLRRPTGGWLSCRSRLAVFKRDPAGQALQLAGTLSDITREAQALVKLERQEASLRLALSAGASGTWDWDLSNDTVHISDSYRELFGIPADSAFGYEGWLASVHPEDRERCAAYGEAFFRSRAARDWHLEFKVQTPHMGVRWHRAVGKLQRDASGNPVRFIGVSSDITPEKEVEERRRESEERFRTMADGLPLIVWVHDENGEQEFVNKTFCEYFGVTLEEMKGDRWQLLMHPDDAEAYSREFMACIRERRPFHGEVRVKNANDDWRWIESWARPRLSGSNEFLGFVGTSADITDRKQLEAEMRNVAALKENFLSLVSHELRGPLSVILAYAQLIVKGSIPQGMQQDAARDILSESQRLNRIIENMLLLGRLEAGQGLPTASVQIDPIIREAVNRFVERYPEAEVEITELPDGLLAIAVEEYIEQVLENLLSNAMKYGEGKVIEVSASSRGAEVEVSVADRGIGIKDPQSVFSAFHREHPETAPGLGLGLTVCYRLVTALGGEIRATSREGGGTTFSFTLPLGD